MFRGSQKKILIRGRLEKKILSMKIDTTPTHPQMIEGRPVSTGVLSKGIREVSFITGGGGLSICVGGGQNFLGTLRG